MIIQEPNGRNILNMSDLTMLLLAREQYGRRRKKGIFIFMNDDLMQIHNCIIM
jgi:hypothetical protein